MPSVRMAADRAVKVEVDVEGMVALIREAGTGRFIGAMLDFYRKCVGADFVSILAYSRTGDPTLVGTATTTAADNARNAAIAYMRHLPRRQLRLGVAPPAWRLPHLSDGG